MSPTTRLKSRPRQAAATPWRNVLKVHDAAELLPRMSDSNHSVPSSPTFAKTPEVEASFEILDCHSSRLLSFLEQFTTILEFCENDSNWPPLNAGRQKRRAKAVRKMRDALVGTDRPCQAGTWPWSPAQDCGGVSVDP
jgi:hypothetical protein